jgi:hypothetical protein
MKKIRNPFRVKKIISETIKSLSLDLTNITVLTEAGSGAYVVTPLIAAIAGASKVYVIIKDSKYGSKNDIIFYLNEYIDLLNIKNNVIEIIDNVFQIANKVNIVTNLGFVRPIEETLISKLPKDAAIPLMWETWEARKEDIDFEACLKYSVPVLGTCETDKRLQIFNYVGVLALKLLLEAEIEVFESKILIVSSGCFLEEIMKVLLNNGANIRVYNPFKDFITDELNEFLQVVDAIVIAEQVCKDVLISNTGKHLTIDKLANCSVEIIHISGVLDYDDLKNANLNIHPEKRINYGYMTVTTDYVGVTPVIKLHSAGLKVGQALVEGLRLYNNIDKAKNYALSNSPAMDFN